MYGLKIVTHENEKVIIFELGKVFMLSSPSNVTGFHVIRLVSLTDCAALHLRHFAHFAYFAKFPADFSDSVSYAEK